MNGLEGVREEGRKKEIGKEEGREGGKLVREREREMDLASFSSYSNWL